MLKRINQFLSSLMLKDILTGMAITGKYLFKPKFTVQYP
jgi:NADH-quinone oxidoreductase subunit I